MSGIFEPVTINGVEFKNRILRSSVGGRHSSYDGMVTDVWKNFEKRFADGGVGGIISTTFHVDEDRLSPPMYPSLATKKHVPYLKKYIPEIKRDRPDCRYIVQLGDPGYVTYESLFPEQIDGRSSSRGFDLVFGYTNRRYAMKAADVEESIKRYVRAAERVVEAGADGIEITASKGYLIHQFLNPGFNRRTDEWGGDADRRFRLLGEIVAGVRKAVGRNYLLGVRLAGADHNNSPALWALLRLPWPPLSRERWLGNEEAQMIDYAQRLQKLNVDFLHLDSGFGFPSPRVTSGKFPFDEARMFFAATRHLSGKAAFRSALLGICPPFWRWLLNVGWHKMPEINLDLADRFKKAVPTMHIIANGGFEERPGIELALRSGSDMVSMARALIANRDLVDRFKNNETPEAKCCSRCNKCVGRTGTSPLGCYDPKRFDNDYKRMYEEILEWNRSDPVAPTPGPPSQSLAPTTHGAQSGPQILRVSGNFPTPRP